MGLLKALSSGDVRTLTARTVIGRSAVCGIRLDAARVSSEHAVVAWQDKKWTVRDLGSRNGTWVEDQLVSAGQVAVLWAGARIRFAEEGWVVHDASPPAPMALRLSSGAQVGATGDVLLLPDEDEPRMSIAPIAAGGWSAYTDSMAFDVADRDTVDVDGERYQLFLPAALEPTVGAGDAIHLRFRVSPDEERVEVEVACAGRLARLGPRSHNYLLLTLARVRMAERFRSVGDRGWVQREDLARWLKVDLRTVAVHVHRIRQEIGQQNVDGAAAVLEVRPRTGQLRVGTDAVVVESSD